MELQDESLSEPERYLSAEGWQPAKKIKIPPNIGEFPTASMLETRSANRWRVPHVERKPRSSSLFGNLWHAGEVAVLIGEKGVGKSVLAVQIAESIARGKIMNAGNERGRDAGSIFAASRRRSVPASPREVLYLDFQRTEAQWHERYSVPSPVPGKLPVRYRFSPALKRAAINWDGHIPEDFKGGVSEYLMHSICQTILESGARVIILDDLSYFAHATSSTRGGLNAMKTLKLWAMTHQLSILVLAPAREKRRWAAASLGDVLGSRQITALADTVIYLGPSTFGPNFRYLRHLASPRQLTHTPENVITYELTRTAGYVASKNTSPQGRSPQGRSPHGSKGILNSQGRSPHDSKGIHHNNPLPSNKDVSQVSSSLASQSPVSPSPQLLHSPTPLLEATPFLTLTDLGPSTEPDHLRNYAAIAKATQKAQERQITRLSHRTNKQILVDGILDGSYERYLKGE